MRLLMLIAICFSNNIYAQLRYTEEYKLYESQISYLGGDEDYNYYVNWKFLGNNYTEEQTFFKIPLNGGEPTFYEKGRLKINDGPAAEVESVIISGYFYSVNKSYTKSGYVTGAYLIKRDLENFDIIGDPKKIEDFEGDVSLFSDKTGLVVLTNDLYSKTNFSNLRRFDLDLNEQWKIDVSSFYPRHGEVVIRVKHDENEERTYFELNLAKCDDCGFFQRDKKVNTAILGISYIDKYGTQTSLIPEIPEGLIYSNIKFYYDENKNALGGVIIAHKRGKSEYDNVHGLAYVFCWWDSETGELIESVDGQLTFKDVLGEDGKAFVSGMDAKATYNPDAFFPRINSIFPTRLENGNILIVCTRLSTSSIDDYYNKEVNPLISNCSFLICFDEKGQKKWSLFIPGFPAQKMSHLNITKDLKLYYLTLGMEENYANGDFKLNKYNNVKGMKSLTLNNAFVYSVIDLSSGEVVKRKSFEVQKSNEYNSTCTAFNEEANKYIVGIQRNSGGGFRKVRFTVLDPNQ